MKEIRLQRITDEETYNKIITIYKEAKQTKVIDNILCVKSFITRIIEAQNEIEFHSGQYCRVWTTLEDYVNNVLYSKAQWPKNVHSPFEYILFIVKSYANTNPFSYKKNKHFGITL